MNATMFLETAASVSLQAALVVLTAWIVRRLGRLGARAECSLWNWAYGIILLLTIVAATFPHMRLTTPDTNDAAEAVSSAQVQLVTGQVLQLVWLAGVAITTLALLVGWWSAGRALRTSWIVEASSLSDFDGGHDLEIEGRPVSVRAGPDVSGPCCWQLHRPYILLPEKVLALAPRQVQFIIRHELAHLRLGHPLQFFGQRVVEILFWFHPLVWWSARQATTAREFACDESVARSRGEIADYLRTLLAVVERTHEPCGQTLGFGAGAGAIAMRARRLVALAELEHLPVETARQRLLRIGLFAACCLICTLAWLPVNSLASSRSWWSPWPAWSASLASDLGLPVRDYEIFDPRSQMFELRHEADAGSRGAAH
ncbi:MAG: M56 family metallopeptidase [Planctomycetaceae bacterium]